MLGFPFYSSFEFSMLFAVFGFFIASLSIYQLVKRNDNGEDKGVFRSGIGALGGTIFFLIGAIFSFADFKQTFSLRNIDISQVSGFKVIKSSNENNSNNTQSIVINDAENVQKALQSLKNCYETSRNEESYQDGYKLKILFFDENLGGDYYISVYRKSNNNEGKSVVIPHFYENKNLDLGEYGCPAFQDWVRTNIDPLFQQKEKLSK